jgi:tetratricopeptide (TPR) repeat protein
MSSSTERRFPGAIARRLAACALLALVAACSTPGPLDQPAKRYEGVDVCHQAITTTSPEAQAWFDQGLTLMYGFNHGEAIRSFAEAARLDPDCTMAWWGLAHASGTDLNDNSMTEDDQRRAYDASIKAVRTSGNKTPVEAALAYAISTRFSWPPPPDRRVLDEDYAAAMGEIYTRFRRHPDIATLYAESLMLLQPWDYWTADAQPKGRITDAIEALEIALSVQPDHAGAAHYLIHALEAGDPERAEAAADQLAGRVPGAGHLLHMPSHIYVHVGRYPDSSDVNERAVAADLAYYETAGDPGFYMLYYAHNVHMLAFSAMMEGREQVAVEAAEQLVRDIPDSFIREQTALMDGLMATPLHVAIRFGRWEAILEEPKPPTYRKLSLAQWHYARGVAFSATGRTEEARKELAAFESVAPTVPEDWRAGSNPASMVTDLAHYMLRGELLWREGKTEEAFEIMREGIALEDSMVYDEPPGWMQPVRHAYGALLMADNRPREAEEVYRLDLERNPDNGWSLLGLELALRAQGRESEATAIESAKDKAWARADIAATSSCFCEPAPVSG